MRELDSLADGWPVISSLLDEALALPAAARSAWLEALPPERDGIKATLRALLATQAEAETDDFLGTLPKLPQRLVAADATLGTEAGEGETVGPYRLISQLGGGGMGDVWLAGPADGERKRRDALKLPRVVWGDALAERLLPRARAAAGRPPRTAAAGGRRGRARALAAGGAPRPEAVEHSRHR